MALTQIPVVVATTILTLLMAPAFTLGVTLNRVLIRGQKAALTNVWENGFD